MAQPPDSLRVVYVRWIDSAQYPSNEWSGPDDEFGPMVLQSAGFVVAETDQVLVIAVDYTAERHETPYRNVSVIPKIAITQCVELDSVPTA